MQVQGDAFLARVFDNEDDFERLDFTLKEVTSSAPWVKEAAAQNEAKRKGDQADTILQRMQVSGQFTPQPWRNGVVRLMTCPCGAGLRVQSWLCV